MRKLNTMPLIKTIDSIRVLAAKKGRITIKYGGYKRTVPAEYIMYWPLSAVIEAVRRGQLFNAKKK